MPRAPKRSLAETSAQNEDATDAGDPPLVTPREEFVCSLTHEVMRDPVMACDGYTYERAAIERWFKQSDKSPLTMLQLPSKTVHPNIALRHCMEREGHVLEKLGAVAPAPAPAPKSDHHTTLHALVPYTTEEIDRAYRVVRGDPSVAREITSKLFLRNFVSELNVNVDRCRCAREYPPALENREVYDKQHFFSLCSNMNVGRLMKTFGWTEHREVRNFNIRGKILVGCRLTPACIVERCVLINCTLTFRKAYGCVIVGFFPTDLSHVPNASDCVVVNTNEHALESARTDADPEAWIDPGVWSDAETAALARLGDVED